MQIRYGPWITDAHLDEQTQKHDPVHPSLEDRYAANRIPAAARTNPSNILGLGLQSTFAEITYSFLNQRCSLLVLHFCEAHLLHVQSAQLVLSSAGMDRKAPLIGGRDGVVVLFGGLFLPSCRRCPYLQYHALWSRMEACEAGERCDCWLVGELMCLRIRAGCLICVRDSIGMCTHMHLCYIQNIQAESPR